MYTASSQLQRLVRVSVAAMHTIYKPGSCLQGASLGGGGQTLWWWTAPALQACLAGRPCYDTHLDLPLALIVLQERSQIGALCQRRVRRLKNTEVKQNEQLLTLGYVGR